MLRSIACWLRNPGKMLRCELVLRTCGISKRRIHLAHSFACRRNRDDTSIAVDRHRRVQCSGATANTLEKLLRAGTLHEKRLKQLRIVWLVSASYRLSFTGDRQNLDFFH